MYEPKEARESLEEITSSQLLEAITDGVVVLDLDLRIRRYNSAFAQMFPQLDPSTGHTCYQAVQHRDTPCTGCPALRCLESGTRETAVIPGPPGSRTAWREVSAVPVKSEATGAYVGVMEHVKDVTDHHALEQTLLEKDAFFQYSGDLFCIIDSQGIFVDINPAWTDVLGWRREDLAGRSFVDLIHPEDRALLQEHRDKHTNVRCACADGSCRQMSLNRYTSGERQFYIARDITQLEQARRNYNRLFSEMQNAFAHHEIICDEEGKPIDYRFLEINPAFERMTGLLRDQIAGQRVLDVLPGTETVWIEAFGRVALTGEPIAFEHFSRSFGKTYSVSAYSPAPGEFAVFFQDVTDRVIIEQDLARERQLLHTIIDHVPVGIYAMDREMRKILVNETDLKHIGALSKEEVLGKTDEELFPPETARQFIEDNRRVIEEGRPVINREEQIIDREGIHRWLLTSKVPLVDESGAVSGLVGIGYDITDKKRYEEKLHALARFPRENPNPVLRVNWEGLVIYVNDVGKRALTSWCLEEGAQAPEFIRDLVSEVQRSDLPKQLELVHGEQTYSFYVVPFAEAGYANLYGANITELLKVKKHQEALEEQLHQVQKIESIGRLAGGVAHDFNNMLGVILGYAELALDKAGPCGEIYDDLVNIKQAAERSVGLTQKLLGFARRQPIQPRVLNLNSRIRSVRSILSRLVGEHIELVWKLQRNLWHVCIDPIQVDQILMNLATNARDAIDGSGRIIIETTNAVIDEQYASEFYECDPGSYVLISVSDTGSGMDKHTMAHAFDPFFTTKHIGEGTGMGLSTIHGIVRQNNGFIHLYSEIGRGTTVRIYIPRSEAEAETSHKPQEHKHQGSETVLVVEDEQGIRDLTAAILQRHGYRVYTAGCCEEVFSLVRGPLSSIDLLITDVVMPGMNGKELAESLAGQLPPFKVIFMSGYTDDVIAHHGILEEPISFIQKPFTAQGLTTLIRSVLDT